MKCFWCIALLLVLFGCNEVPQPSATAVQVKNLVEMLESAPINPVKLHGELSDVFAPFSDYTELQRENIRRKVIGSAVQWDLPIYEVYPPEGGVYKVTTPSGTFAGKDGKSFLMAVIFITPRDDKDRALLDALKTNDVISFKGVIADIHLRSAVRVTPAILYYGKR